MSFETQLDRIASASREAGKKEFEAARALLTRTMLGALESNDWRTGPAHLTCALEECGQSASKAAELIDAADFVMNHALDAKHCSVIDVDVRGDFATRNARIQAVVRDARSFVYVAWRQKPERYFYVGRGKDQWRVELTRHGKLATALAEGATRLSIVWPGQSRPANVRGVEASILRLLTHWCGEVPVLNSRPEPVPPMTGSERLAKLAAFFDEVASCLE